ncbi:MAG: DUF748 domain-containing protein [Pseudomonadota bacterium]
MKRWLWWLIGLVTVYGLLGFFALPWYAKPRVETLAAEALGRAVSIGRLRCNPFALSATLEDVSIEGLPTIDGRDRLLSATRIYVNAALPNPFTGTIRVDDVALDELDLALTQTAKGLNVTHLPGIESSPAAETEQPDAARPLRVSLARILLNDGRITYTDSSDASRAEPLQVTTSGITISAADIATIRDVTGTLSVAMRIDDALDLAWQGSTSLEPLRLEGELQLEGAPGTLINRLAANDAARFEGGEFELRIDTALTPELEVQLADGLLDVASLDLTFEQQALQIAALSLVDIAAKLPADNPQAASATASALTIDGGRLAVLLDAQAPEHTPPQSTSAPAEAGEAIAGTDEPVNDSTTPGLQVELEDLRISDFGLAVTDPGKQLELTAEVRGSRLGTASPGTIDLTLASASGGSLRTEGTLDLRDLDAPIVALNVTPKDLSLAPALGYLDLPASALQGTLNGALTLRNDADGPAYAGTLDLTGFALRRGDTELATLERLAAGGIDGDGAGLVIGTLALERPQTSLRIDADGASNWQDASAQATAATEASAAPDAEQAAAADQGADAYRVRIGALNISDAALQFADATLPGGDFALNLAGLQGSVTGLDSANEAPAQLSLKGTLNEYGSVDVSGNATLFDPRKRSELLLEFANLRLHDYSPYSVKFAGRAVATGKLDLSIKYDIENARMRGDHSVRIKDIGLGERVEYPDAMDLPLQLAIALLTDPSGKLALDVGMRGDLSDPSFSYGSLVMKALANVLAKLVTAPFKLLGGLLPKGAAPPDTLSFPVDSAVLAPEQLELLDTLATAIAKRPALGLRINPGFATGAAADDAEPAAAVVEAPELATARASAIRERLLAANPELAERIRIGEPQPVSAQEGGVRTELALTPLG